MLGREQALTAATADDDLVVVANEILSQGIPDPGRAAGDEDGVTSCLQGTLLTKAVAGHDLFGSGSW
jgi:hypothetical protein